MYLFIIRGFSCYGSIKTLHIITVCVKQEHSLSPDCTMLGNSETTPGTTGNL